jgi:hypothetical protein
MNLSRSGPSFSVGHRGTWLTVGSRGVRATAGIPGTGVFWTERVSPARTPHGGHQLAFVVLVLVAVLFVAALI